MKSNEELYHTVDRLVTELQSLQEFERADKLKTAMYISTVGTEVFFNLGYELRQLLKSKINLNQLAILQAKEAIAYIVLALGPN